MGWEIDFVPERVNQESEIAAFGTGSSYANWAFGAIGTMLGYWLRPATK
jgi:hypothetical protein